MIIGLLSAVALLQDRIPVTLPDARHGHRAHVADGTVVLLGGFKANSEAEDRGARDVWLLKPRAKAWIRGAPMPKARSFFGSAVIGQKLYAIGETVDALDLKSGTWAAVRIKGQLPSSHFACAELDGRIYTLGGFPATLGGFRSFDPKTGVVRLEPPMPGMGKADHFHFFVRAGKELHAIGGLAGESFEPMATHHVFDGGSWRTLGVPPAPIWAKFGSAAVVGDAIYAFADGRGLRYDLRNKRWTTIAPMPKLLVMPATISDGRTITILGGMGVRANWHGILRYDTRTRLWSIIAVLSSGGAG